MKRERGFIQLPMMAWGAIAAGVAMAALLTWGLYWRGEYREAKAVNVALAAQAKVLVGAVEKCSAGAEKVAEIGNLAIAGMGSALEKINKAKLPTQKTIERIERVIEKPTPLGPDGRPLGCDAAWDLLEADRQKARAAP